MAEDTSRREKIKHSIGEKFESQRNLSIPFIGNKEEIGNKDKVFNAIKEVSTPNLIKEKPRHAKINNKMYRVRTVVDWPKTVEVGFLNDLLKSDTNVDLSMRINPIENVRARENIEKAITYRQQQKEIKLEEGKTIPATLQTEIQDLKELKTALHRGEEALYDIKLNAIAKGRTEDELDKNSRTVKHKLNSINLVSKVPGLKQLKALKESIPTGEPELANAKKVPTSTAVGMFPFTTKYAKIDKTGIVYGVNRDTANLVVRDNFNFTNPNWFIIATSGAGKSYTAKNKIINDHIKGVKNFIIDPHGEYEGLMQELNGQNLTLSPHSETMINPLDLMGHTYREKLLALDELYHLMFPDLGSSQKRKIMEATRKVYRARGIEKNNEKAENQSKEMPTMQDLKEQLQRQKANEEDSNQLSSYDVAIGKVDKYVNGAYDFFNTQTRVSTDAQLINFDIQNLPKASWPIAMYLITNYLYSQMTEGSQRRKQLVVDEGWKLLQGLGGGEESFLKEMVKSSRKYNLSLGLLIQNVEDLLESESAGDAIMANTSMKILMEQDDAVLPNLAKELHLNQSEKQYLQTASTGEALMIADGEKIPLEVIADDKIHEIITTDPSEKKKLEAGDGIRDLEAAKKQIKKEGGTDLTDEISSSGVEEDKFPENDIYNEDRLSDHQIDLLENDSNWERTTTIVFGSGRGRAAWVKCKGQVSAEHEKVVHTLSKHIQNNYDTIVETTRKHADLEIEHKDKKIGIEVETGVNSKKDTDGRLEKKVKQNDKNYDKWVILTLDSKTTHIYQEYAPTYTRGNIKERIDNLLG